MAGLDLIRQNALRDLSDGVMAVGLDGTVLFVNPAACRILGREEDGLKGKPFALCFFEYAENDGFNQAVLDAVYAPEAPHSAVVPFFTGRETRTLRVTCSALRGEEKVEAVIAVLSDITELAELRDAVKAMERIRALNGQLEARNRLLQETFGRYLSDDVVKELLDTPDGLALGGKKAELTVFMSDLRGFTALSERMAPAELIAMLNRYLGRMTEIIQARGGTIIEFIGDGILAVFGAPLPLPNHAEAAAACALECQLAMADMNRENAQRRWPALSMGIGLHTGEVIVGNLGSEKRAKYGVAGMHVNLAGRIESCTVGGQILLSESTARRIESVDLCISETLTVTPKGADEPLTLLSLVGMGAPIGLRLQEKDAPAEPLAVPCPVFFRRLSGKTAVDERLEGRFTALSWDKALLQSDTPMEPLDNLALEFGGNTCAKVRTVNKGMARVTFTARGDRFGEALQSAQNAR